MRHTVLLSSVLIGLTVLPLYSSSKTACDFDWGNIGRYERNIIQKTYNLFTGYENISSFDIKTANISDAYDKMRNIIDYVNIPYTRTENYAHYLDLPWRHSELHRLQEIFINWSGEIRRSFRDKSDECPWLNHRSNDDLKPSEIHVERKLMEWVQPLFNYLFRFISDSPSKEPLLRNPVIQNLFKDKKNIELRDLLHLVGIQLRKPSNETKLLLKMTLTELIRKYISPENVITLACYTKKLDNNVFLQFSGVPKKEFHNYIDKLVNHSLMNIRQHGLYPYKELAYTLVEELELINIHDVTFNWYSLIMNVVDVIKKLDWNSNLEKIDDAWTQCLMDLRPLLDEILCHKKPGIEKNMLKMLDNLESDAMIAFLQDSTAAVIKNIEYCSQKTAYCIPPYYKDSFHRLMDMLFTIPQHSVELQLAAYLKSYREEGAINQLFTYNLDMEELLGHILGMLDRPYGYMDFSFLYDFDATIDSLGSWIDQTDFPLFRNVAFSNECCPRDRDVIFEPIRQVHAALLMVYQDVTNFYYKSIM